MASTLAYTSHFPLATYQLYAAIGNFPPSFPAAAAMGWLLVASVAIPLALQARALRGRSYAVLSGRTRLAVRRELGAAGRSRRAGGVGLLLRRGARHPGFGAVSGRCSPTSARSFRLTLVNYRAVFARHSGPGRGAARALARLRRGHRLDHRRRRVHRRPPARPAPDAGDQGARLPAARRGRAAERRLRRGLHLRLQPAVPLPDRHRHLPDDDAARHRLHRLEPADERPRPGRRGLPGAGVAARRGAGPRGGRDRRLGCAACSPSCPGRS